jgi:hypothetical protein
MRRGSPLFFLGGTMDVHEALKAIGSTGEGFCWYCDAKLPAAESAIREGWDVQRIASDRVASIILVCPACLTEKTELGEEVFLRNLSLRVCNSTC